ncbi:MAG: type 1 glutamine amidotransferase [Candidatus Aenigmatarchaeota archaeon]
MRILILNCDFDKNPETNGAQLLRSHLSEFNVKVIIRNVFENQFPTEEELKTFGGILITGSRASVYEDTEWIKKLVALVRLIDNLGIPTLGICFGYQIIAQTLGGNVQASGKFEEGFKLVELTREGIRNHLFNGFPQQFKVYQSHGDIANVLPEKSVVLVISTNSCESYQIRNFFGVQFHPEILYETAVKMAIRDGKDVNKILDSVNNNYKLPINILANFVSYCKTR